MRTSVLGLFLLNCATTAVPESETASPSRGEDPEYRAEIQRFCDVDRLSGVDTSDPLDATERRENYLLEHTKHPDALYFLTVWRTKPSAEQADLLAAEARGTQIANCALASTLAKQKT